MSCRRLLPVLAILALPSAFSTAGPAVAGADQLQLHLRTRVQPFKSADAWQEESFVRSVPARQTAIIICDMWDDHWCKSAARRCAALARQMDPVLRAARARGVTIIHAPSECMSYYKDFPQRRRVLELPHATPPRPRQIAEPPLPVDDSDGGCDDANPSKMYRAWHRENAALTIGLEDFISDNGQEVYNILQHRGIKTLLVCGVHTNMCVLGRSFAIRQMTRWGIPCVLIRDLTDSMYNPERSPKVRHEEGTSLIIRHIEKYWCPSMLSADLVP